MPEVRGAPPRGSCVAPLADDLRPSWWGDLAIAVFELNVRLFPDEANPYDSLAEAYLKKGDRAAAIERYAKALEVDPGFTHAREALDRLQANEAPE